MHILVVPSWYSNSVQENAGNFFRNHAHSLQSLGHQVGVAFYEGRVLRTLSPRGIAQNHFQLTDQIEFGMQTVRVKGWNPLAQSAFGAKIWCRLAQKPIDVYIKRHGKPDVIHAQSGLWGGLAAMHSKERHGIPYVVTEHSCFVPNPEGSPKTNQLYALMARRADRFTAVSHSLSKMVSEATGLTDIEVIPNCLDLEFWKVDKEPKNRSVKFFAAGGLVPLKGYDTLIEALSKVKNALPEATLTIAGSGPEKARLESAAQQFHIADAVQFVGEVTAEEIRRQMVASTCFVCSSDIETFGVALLEALATGTPVVSTRCGGPEDFVAEPSGILVPLRDSEAMAAAMIAQATGDPQSKALHCKQVASRYDQVHVGRQLEAAFASAIGN